MAKTNWQDPKTSEMRSTHVAGLMEAVGKIEDSIGMESVYETNVPLTEVFISSDDRYRIFQAPEGKRNWTAEQPPVIKRNGSIITSGFEIDYGGGAIVLNVNDTVENTYTADVTYIKQTEISSIKTARFVVGTSTSGWTEKDCDYLCDGTNDTTIINSAIQALPATGGEIVLLDGIYTVKNPAQTKITLKSNVLLRGNGVGTIIQPPLNYQYAQNLIQVSGNNVSICNLAIKPNGTHTVGMVSIETNTGIRGLRIQYCYLGLPIVFRQGSDFLIADNKFEANSLSLTGTVTLSIIRGNSFFSAQYDGLSLTRLSSSIVAGNLIQDFDETRSGIVLGSGTGDYGGNIVANNIIRQTIEGSSIGINISGSGSKKNLVMGNHIVGVKTGIRDLGSDNVIENNIVN
jgi:hypothetical protein